MRLLGSSVTSCTRLVVHVVARVHGHVLHERAAERDVQHLDAAAHAERRLIAFDERAAQRDLGVVAPRVERAGLGCGRGAVARRLDVAAAGDDHRVDGVERGVELGAVVGVDDRQDTGIAPARRTAFTYGTAAAKCSSVNPDSSTSTWCAAMPTTGRRALRSRSAHHMISK